jgi:hypothetical protein
MLVRRIALSLPFGARAQEVQTIEVLLSDAPGAPTPAQIVSWAHSSPRSSTMPLQAFNTKAPLRVDHLMADRATGDFLAWLNANPNSARKKLEDVLLTAFPVADIPAALAALQADPYVANAAIVPAYELHSVELTDFEVVPEGPLGGNDQYG